MNRLLLLIIVAGITFLIVLFALKPELIESIWLWLIGLAGAVIKGFQLLMNYIKEKFGDDEGDKSPGDENTVNTEVLPEDDFNGITLTLLRYKDDGDTTLGLLYIEGKFYCYTLEDTYNEVKIPGKTRIPAGVYNIELRKEMSKTTTSFRERFPLWFIWHLWLRDIPEFEYIYIHNGGEHEDTEGCILVSDSLNINNSQDYLTNSAETFRRLYAYLYKQLNNNVNVRIKVFDEKEIINKIS